MISRIRKIIVLICLGNGLAGLAMAQTATEKAQLGARMLSAPAKVTYKEAAQNKNEVETVFSGLFLAYKNLISSQDSYKCTFHPSCSEYGIIAVKQLGAVRGMLSTFDRLSRCNGLSPEKYAIDMERKVLIDNVESK